MDTIIDTNAVDLAVMEQHQQCASNNNNNNNNNMNSLFDDDSLVNYFLSEDISMISSGESPIHTGEHNLLSSPHSHPSSPLVVPNSSPFESHHSMTSPEHSPNHTDNINNNNCYIVDTNQFDAYSFATANDHMISHHHSMDPSNGLPEFPVQIEDFKLITPDSHLTIKEEIDQSTGYLCDTTNQFMSSSPIDELSSPVTEESINSSSGEREASSPIQSNKQKKRAIENNSRVQNLVHPLTREELLKLTGKEPVRIEDTPTTCLADERQVKKQRRLIKNRESAQLSRMRKKIYIEDLEKKIGDLTTENGSLRDEVLYLQGIIKQFASTNPEISNQLQQHESMRTKNAKAAGVCLLIIIFSIGIFLNPQQQSQPTFTTNSNSLVNTRRALSNSNNNNANSDLYLSMTNVDDDEVVPSDDTLFITPPQSPTPSSESSLVLSSGSGNKKRNLESPATIVNDNNSPATHNKKRIRIIPLEEDQSDTDRPSDPPTRLVVDSPLRVVPSSPRILSGDTESDFNLVASSGHLVQDGPIHSSYIVCSDQPRIISNNLTQTTESILNSNPSSPLTIAAKFPTSEFGIHNTSALNNTLTHHPSNPTSSFHPHKQNKQNKTPPLYIKSLASRKNGLFFFKLYLYKQVFMCCCQQQQLIS
ncbi:putative basic-leucine zipper transcription factor [Heterostelium album PN500]|uniref:Putative basic-leucine zipper transcription factor n=1 Tax=Heterostelium pallidum (strain ATCC 26659 / Pp 5 / PN500) TaxID=670386 RepID=D3BB80_HETP5|nr:putative basic-leucine zipper transcription factor [Heterostelium album PN500]EFA81287.1 putative basic-leucine zipper transcription factor [Heterostelium album PN500]|eukprot:XP_020433405.1 putative basic-leucine zipper transcription factor [Heterostelium album PN500]